MTPLPSSSSPLPRRMVLHCVCLTWPRPSVKAKKRHCCPCCVPLTPIPMTTRPLWCVGMTHAHSRGLGRSMSTRLESTPPLVGHSRSDVIIEQDVKIFIHCILYMLLSHFRIYLSVVPVVSLDRCAAALSVHSFAIEAMTVASSVPVRQPTATAGRGVSVVHWPQGATFSASPFCSSS